MTITDLKGNTGGTVLVKDPNLALSKSEKTVFLNDQGQDKVKIKSRKLFLKYAESLLSRQIAQRVRITFCNLLSRVDQ